MQSLSFAKLTSTEHHVIIETRKSSQKSTKQGKIVGLESQSGGLDQETFCFRIRKLDFSIFYPECALLIERNPIKVC